MKIIILSGGSGKRLWPLSNDARSKQFLKLLKREDGTKESMIQRVVRQIKEAGLTDGIIVTTGISQKDAVENQLGSDISVVTEPDRRHTLPAIMLACSYLKAQDTDPDEPVIVMPCDTFAPGSYFNALRAIADAVVQDVADIVLMGLKPVYPSAKYGYILPAAFDTPVMPVAEFVEKPDVAKAEELIAAGALWNGGVFAFKLGYMTGIIDSIRPDSDYNSLRAGYSGLPVVSFDYGILEKADSMAVVPYHGSWKDLGTWNTLTDELTDCAHGNVITEECHDSYIINELEIPMACLGVRDMVIVATPDGILVSERKLSENIKHIVHQLGRRPMYERRRWGEYKVIDNIKFDDGFCALTKQLTITPGCSISYQRHNCRNEVWTFIDGEGEIVLDGIRSHVDRGDVINIRRGQMHALRAITPLTMIEVQQGRNLVEDDIERFPYDW